MHILPEDGLETLEFDKIIDLLSAQCNGEPSRRAARELTPSLQRSEIDCRLDEVAEFKQGTEERNLFTIGAYEEAGEELRSLAVEGFVLPEAGLARINVLLLQARTIFQFFGSSGRQNTYQRLYARVRQVDWQPELSEAIEAVIDEEGRIRADASAELARIRQLIGSKQREIDRVFAGVIQKYRRAGYLTDSAESYRNGRRVLSVPAEHKRSIRGIIHDESASGKTAFIEPDEVIGINNDLFDLAQEERREIQRILRELSATLRPYVDTIAAYRDLIADLDLVQAKARLAHQLSAERPAVADEARLNVKEGRHPLLLLKNKRHGRKTIAFTLWLDQKSRLLMLSGPNAGGKSIVMKSVGLLQLMVQCGMLVPVDGESTFGIFHRLFTDIGDQQSLEDDLSTYSSRLRNARAFMKAADNRTLLLIDEFGAGTDPALGGAIAEGVLERLLDRGVYGVATTHYGNLKLYAYKKKGVVNGGMDFDKESLVPTYKLRIGRPGSSYAFEIAQQSGLPHQVLDYARKRAGKKEGAVDQLLVDLQREKQEVDRRLAELEQKQKTLDALTRTYEELHRDIEVRRKRLKLEAKEQSLAETARYNKEMENLIRRLREEKKVDEAKQHARQLREQREQIGQQVSELRENIYYAPPQNGKSREFSVGDTVKLRTGARATGTIESIDKKRATIVVGDLRMTAKLRDLEAVSGKLDTRDTKSVTSHVRAVAQFENKLDVRGMRYEEALSTTQAFVDRALMANASNLRIVHGKGSGALRRAVREKLKEYSQDFTLTTPPREQGGEGVTIVEL